MLHKDLADLLSVGPLGRVAEGGRNWEGFSADPYLSGKLVAQHIRGVQSNGVGTCTKHYIGNEQETDRNPTTNSQNETVASLSSNIDDTTMHELYLWPFVDAVHAGTVSIMCSYNRINNSYACQNSKTLNGILKTELGSQGYVVSDWFAQHSGVASAEAGLDMVMPSGLAFWGPNLTEAVRNGSLPEARLDDMATRIMATWHYTNQNNGYPARGVGMPASLSAPHEVVNARNPSARPGLMQAAVEGHVLVKNVNNTLPLQKPRLLTVYGYDAVNPQFNTPTPGLSSWALGLTSTDVYSVLCGFSEALGPCTPFRGYAANGTIYTGGGSGATSPAYISAPLDAIQARAMQDGDTVVYWDTQNINATGAVEGATDACLVFINAEASEGVDRPALYDSYSDSLVINIANQCSNTIVTIHNAGIRLVDNWIDHPNVTAVIYAHLPGQDSGRALVSILYGDVSPSGKLPYTVARNESDYGAILSPVQTPEESEYSLFPQDAFSEGVYIDYRSFDAKNITPRYEFGYGLTYTTFSYSDISISKISNPRNQSAYATGAIIPGGHADLFANVVTVSATITNTGSVGAAEIAQLYVGIPASGQPVRQLRGFEKVFLTPGASETVHFYLQRRDLSVWDAVAQNWRMVVGGQYIFSVGASSRDLPLTGTMTL